MYISHFKKGPKPIKPAFDRSAPSKGMLHKGPNQAVKNNRCTPNTSYEKRYPSLYCCFPNQLPCGLTEVCVNSSFCFNRQ